MKLKLIFCLLLTGILTVNGDTRLRNKRQFNQNYQPGANFANFKCDQPNGCTQVGGSNFPGPNQQQNSNGLNPSGQQGLESSQNGQPNIGQTGGAQNSQVIPGQTGGAPNGQLNPGQISGAQNAQQITGQNQAGQQNPNSCNCFQAPCDCPTNGLNQPGAKFNNGLTQNYGNGDRVLNVGKRSARLTRRSDFFNQDYQAGSQSSNYNCVTFGACGSNNMQSNFYQSYGAGSQSTNIGRKKRSDRQDMQILTKRDAEPQFNQNYHPGSFSTNNQCSVPGACGNGNSFSTFNQDYFGGSFSTNNGGRKKRSENMLLQKLIQVSPAYITKRDAEAQFNQNYHPGSFSTNNQCSVPGACGNGNSFSTFNQDYFGGSSSINNGGRKKRSENMLLQKLIQVSPAHLTKRDAEAQFNQNYQPGSNSVNNQCLTPGSCGNGHSFSTFNQGYYGGSSSINNGRR